jgi:hypothetical protein
VQELSQPFRIAPLLIAALLCIGAGSDPVAKTAREVLDRHPPRTVRQLHASNLVLLPDAEDGSIYIGALVLFDQPLERTLRLLSQSERQSEYLPLLKRVETIDRDGTVVIDEHHVRILFIPINYRLRTETDFDAARIWWSLDATHDNDLRVLEGYWQLYEFEGARTLGVFGTRVVLGPALPAFLQDAATRRNVPRMVERIRLWVNSDGRYRP